MKNAKKTPKTKNHKYFCNFCSFGCNKKSDFLRHENTLKHLKASNAINPAIYKNANNKICEFCNKSFKHLSSYYRHKKTCKYIPSQLVKLAKNLPKISQPKFECFCGKTYKHASSLSKHKLKCKFLHDEDTEMVDKTEIIPTNNVEKLLKNIMMDNKAILEENKILREEIKNLKLGNTMINSNNNSFNINMFLNEKCKNAMNLEDFVQKIKLSLEDLNYTKDNGYTKGISNIFIKNLNNMDITERPIHCSDQKRLQFYIKDADEWKRDMNNEKIDKTIAKVSKKQIQNLEKWVKANPDYLDSDTKTQEYYKLVRNLAQQDNDKNLRSIKKKVGENIKIDK